MDTFEYNIKKKISKIINKKIKYIVKGYEVINKEVDGCDEYGFLYWVECRNGFYSRSWEIFSKLRKDLNDLLFSYLENGIMIYDSLYFLDPKYLLGNVLKKKMSIDNIVLIDYSIHKSYFKTYYKLNELYEYLKITYSKNRSINYNLSNINQKEYLLFDKNKFIEEFSDLLKILPKKTIDEINEKYEINLHI